MAGFKLNLAVMLVVMVAYMRFHTTVAKGTSHVVGGKFGWNTPPVGVSVYSLWAKAGIFKVGDDLIFNFTTGKHTVAEVSQKAYDLCRTNEHNYFFPTGPATVPLTKAGTRNYICTMHCNKNQKFQINVK